MDGEGFVDVLSNVQAVKGAVGGEAPGASGVDRQAADGAHCRADREAVGCVVHVRAGQRAAGAQGGVGLRQCHHCAAHGRGVVGAQQAHGQHLRGAVGRGHRDAVGIGRAAHKLVVRAVHRVGPVANCVDAELAKAVAALHVALHCEQRRAVHVRGTECAPGALDGVALGQARRSAAGDYGRVVGAGHGDGDDLRRAVGCGHRDAVGVVGASGKLVVRVVCGVAPSACCVDAELAKTVAACHIRLHHKGRRAVHIGGAQAAAGAQTDCVVGLGQAGCAGSGDHGRVVGAGHGDGDDLRRAVGCGHRDAVGVVGASGKLVVRVVCGVAPSACCVDAELAKTVAACHIRLHHKGRRAVHIGGAQAATGAQVDCAVGLGQAGCAGACNNGLHLGSDLDIVIDGLTLIIGCHDLDIQTVRNIVTHSGCTAEYASS